MPKKTENPIENNNEVKGEKQVGTKEQTIIDAVAKLWQELGRKPTAEEVEAIIRLSASVEDVEKKQEDEKGNGFLEVIGPMLRDKTNEKGDVNKLGWKNKTCNLDKINDVELLFATQFNMDFIDTHHKVGELLDAANSLGNYSVPSMSDIYGYIAAGYNGINRDILVYERDENGELLGNPGVGLYEMAWLRRVKNFWQVVLHPEDKRYNEQQWGMTVEEKFAEGGSMPLIIWVRDNDGNKIEKKEIPDLRQVERLQPPEIKKEEFEEYYKVIIKNQMFLQYLSTLRDSNDNSMSRHHAENCGHVQSRIGLNGEVLYLPVTGTMAGRYTRGEVAKNDVTFLANHQSHEVGDYDENTGLVVRYEYDALRIWRSNIDDYHKYKTKGRTAKNLSALGSTEEAIVDKEKRIMWFGKQDKDGKIKKGKIYDAMHNHYDQLMQEKRGYKLTDEEAGDKIMTDIVIPHFVTQPKDWLMTFVTNSQFDSPQNILTERVAREEDGYNRPVMVFYTKRPRGIKSLKKDFEYSTKDEYDYGELHICGFTALAKYINWRIKCGDVDQIDKASLVDEHFISKMPKEKEKNEDESKKVASAINVEEDNKLHHERDGYDIKIAQVMDQIYKDESANVLTFLSSGLDKITRPALSDETDGPSFKNENELVEDLEVVLRRDSKLFDDVKKIVNETTLPASARRLVEILKSIAKGKDGLKPDRLKELLTAEKVSRKPKK